MLHLGKIAAVILIAGATTGGFKAGTLFEERQLRPTEIANGCAYYDMDNGAFRYGPRPVTIGVIPNHLPDLAGAARGLNQAIQNATKPKERR